MGATEKVTFNPPENNQLYSISGSSVEKFVANTPEDTILFSAGGVGLTKQEWNYGYYGDDNDPGTSGIVTLGAGSVPTGVSFIVELDGNGSLFSLGEKDESVTWSYNKSSIGFGTEDWGYVYEQAAPVNWGFITDPVGGSDQNWGLITETDFTELPFGTILFDQTVEGDTRLLYLYQVTGAGTSGGITISGRPLVHPEVDYTPHYGIDQNIGIGTTGIQISGEIETPIRTFAHEASGNIKFLRSVFEGSNLTLDGSTPTFDSDQHYWDSTQGTAAKESFTGDPPEGVVLYTASGTASETFIAQTPEDVVLFRISGEIEEPLLTFSEVGIPGIITLTGTGVERQTDDYVGVGIATFVGDAETRPIGVFGQGGTSTDGGGITILGELNHPNIDYTHIMVLTRILALVQLVSCSPSVQVDLIFLEIQLVEDTTHQFIQAMRVELKDLVVLVLAPSDLMMIENLLSRELYYHTLVEVLLMSQVLLLRHLAIKSMMM